MSYTSIIKSVTRQAFSTRMNIVSATKFKFTREESQIIRDKPVSDFLSRAYPELNKDLEGWARSYYTAEGHIQAIKSFQGPTIPEPTNLSWDLVKRNAHRLFETFPKVQALKFETDFKSVPFESSSSAGYGYTGKKGDTGQFSRAVKIANATVRSFDEAIKSNNRGAILQLLDNTTPDIAYTRTQLTLLAEKLKVRNVFGAPFHSILTEGLSASPLMEFFANNDTFITIGRDPRVQVPELINKLTKVRSYVYCLDWSKFDASVHEWEIELAFDLLKKMLVFPTPLSETAFEWSKLNFTHRKLAGPDGNIYFKHAGVPSGSYFTILVDSIVNYNRIMYLFHKVTGKFPPEVHTQGDDSIVKTDEKDELVHPEALAKEAASLNWILNPEKVKISDRPEDLEYLGRGVSAGYNTRDRLKVLRLAVFTEYEVPDPAISTARITALNDDSSYRIPELIDAYRYLKYLYGEVQQAEIPKHLMPAKYASVVRM